MEIGSSWRDCFVGGTKRVVIVPHARPDADALGSALALAQFLRKKSHEVVVVLPSAFPTFLSWMPGIQNTLLFSSQEDRCVSAFQSADVVVCVDFSVPQRVEDMSELLLSSRVPKIVVDHHPPKPVNFGDHLIWSDQAAATAQLLQKHIIWKEKELMDKDIAECLYVGMMTDTGSFRHGNVTSELHRMVAALMEYEVDIAKISRHVYGSYSEERLRFLGFALSKCLRVEERYHTAYFVVREKDMRRFKLTLGDTEGLVNYALSMEHIVLGVLIKEYPDMVKLSLRSKGKFPANEMASDHFCGGGHLNAAGGCVKSSVEEVVQQLKSLLPKYEAQLKQEFYD